MATAETMVRYWVQFRRQRQHRRPDRAGSASNRFTDALERYALPFLQDQPVPPVLMVPCKRRMLAGIERLLIALQETLWCRSRGPNRPAP